jgi:hypothetical protein
MTEDKPFRIQDYIKHGLVEGKSPIQRGDTGEPVTWVSWRAVEPIRARCLRAHGQTLERLAERGGLSLGELWAHLNGLDLMANETWDAMPKPNELRAWARLLR